MQNKLKKIIKKSVKKTIKKSISKSYSVVKQTKKLKSATLKPKSSKKYFKATNKTNKSSRLKAENKKVVKPKVTQKRTNEQLVKEVAKRAEKKVGGSGSVAGTKKHTYAKKLLDRYQKIYGDRGLQTEKSFKNSNYAKHYGEKGSVRVDVWDTKTGTAYDYKFTKRKGRGLSKKQTNKILKHAKGFINEVKEVNP